MARLLVAQQMAEHGRRDEPVHDTGCARTILARRTGMQEGRSALHATAAGAEADASSATAQETSNARAR